MKKSPSFPPCLEPVLGGAYCKYCDAQAMGPLLEGDQTFFTKCPQCLHEAESIPRRHRRGCCSKCGYPERGPGWLGIWQPVVASKESKWVCDECRQATEQGILGVKVIGYEGETVLKVACTQCKEIRVFPVADRARHTQCLRCHAPVTTPWEYVILPGEILFTGVRVLLPEELIRQKHSAAVAEKMLAMRVCLLSIQEWESARLPNVPGLHRLMSLSKEGVNDINSVETKLDTTPGAG